MPANPILPPPVLMETLSLSILTHHTMTNTTLLKSYTYYAYPFLQNLQLSDEDKRVAIIKWKESRAKVERKPRDMSSHVYYCMQKELVPDSFYGESKEGLKILQDYRWECKICLVEPQKTKAAGQERVQGLCIKTPRSYYRNSVPSSVWNMPRYSPQI